MVLFAGTRGLLDKVPVERVREWETAFRQFMSSQRPEVAQMLVEQGQISDEIEAKLRSAIEDFNRGWS
jgi:F-type H+-transporting ATPase subunit alpha